MLGTRLIKLQGMRLKVFDILNLFIVETERETLFIPRGGRSPHCMQDSLELAAFDSSS